jgi:hypothetical protein
MISTRLAGGLGNQIFQFAAALLYTSNKQGISFDISGMSNYESKHINELTRFFDLSKLKNTVSEKESLVTKIRLAKLCALKIYKWPLIGDRNFIFTRQFTYSGNIYLDGYFQEGLTQEEFDKEVGLLKPLLVRTRLSIKEENICVVHIRGGDFVKLGWHTIAPKEYYQKAIAYMQLELDNRKFHIVTDDRNYARNIFKDMNIDYEFIGSDIVEDFFLIGLYKNRILSSSTFSFWASALGDNDDSLVIAPSYWTPNRERKIFLPNEIRLEGF